MDHFLQHWINRKATSPFWDHVMAAITNFTAWELLFFFALIMGVILGNFRLRAMIFCLVITVGFTDGILIHSIKRIAERPRPREMEPGVRTVELVSKKPEMLALASSPNVKFPKVPPLGTPVRGHSFPSAHSANIMAAVMVIFLFYRRKKILFLFLLALSVCYSRIYVGAHWPSDVLVGIILGLLSGFVITHLINKAWKSWGRSLAPKVTLTHPSLLK